MHDGKPDIRSLEADSYQQSGYFTADQAREHGVSSQLLNHHVRQGRFERVRRGLYRIRGFPSSEHDDMREKWMAVGMDKAVLSHESALSLLDLSDNVPDKVHLLVPRRSRGLRRPPGVVIHTHPDDEKVSTVWRDAMPVTARANARGRRRRAPTRAGSYGGPAGAEPRSPHAPAARAASRAPKEDARPQNAAPGSMRYATAAAFRQALDDRLKIEAAKTGLGIARLRKRVAFELFLRRLVAVAPDRWVLKGALALTSASTQQTPESRGGSSDAR